jgi:ParB family chromosome partitioning protein
LNTKSVIMVNPFECRMWALHDRLDDHITEETCRAEIDSIVRHGQLVPALGRPLHGDPRYKVELIYGARRLFIARHINAPLAVELREVSDREAIIAMDIENRHRRDISPYERGLSYARWLRTRHFASQEELARCLKVSASQVSRLLKLGQLPSAIIDAFHDPADICEGWGLDLFAALQDPLRRPRTLQAARTLAAESPRLAASEVYRRLRSAATPGAQEHKSHDRVVKDGTGVPLFRVKYQRKSVALVLSLDKLSARSLNSICNAVGAIMDESAAPEGRHPAHRPRAARHKSDSTCVASQHPQPAELLLAQCATTMDLQEQ